MNTRILFKLFLLFIVAITYSSCSENDESPEEQVVSIKFKSDSEEYVFEEPVYAESANITINGTIGSNENDTDYAFISIWFPLGVTPGTYDFTGNALEIGDYKLRLDSTPLDIDFGWASSGTVTVTSTDNEYIVGTFSATVNDNSNEVILTEGEFKVWGIGVK